MVRESTPEHGHAEKEREERKVRDTYGAALILVLFATLALVAAGSPLESPLAVGAGLLQVGALVLTLRVSGFRARWSTATAVVAVSSVALVVYAHYAVGDAARIPGILLWLLLSLLTIVAVARRLVTYSRVTLQLLMGLLVIYIVIGVSFGLAYLLSNDLGAQALSPGNFGISGAVYFSFVTLATVGYGDLVPATDIARAMAIAEALIGQLYLVSVVSLAVSRLGARRFAYGPAQFAGDDVSILPTPDENAGPVFEEPTEP